MLVLSRREFNTMDRAKSVRWLARANLPVIVCEAHVRILSVLTHTLTYHRGAGSLRFFQRDGPGGAVHVRQHSRPDVRSRANRNCKARSVDQFPTYAVLPPAYKVAN